MNNNDTMTLFPTTLRGEYKTPPSKSMTHRALICSALANGKSTITNFVLSEDIKATIDALTKLGAKFDIQDDKVYVEGVKRLKAPTEEVYCNESGSTLRFMIPIFSLTGKEVTFTGAKSLIKRPQSVYEKIFKEDDIPYTITKESIMVNGSIKAREYTLDGSVSSQFFTGLMFSLPLLKENSYIYFKNTLESESYIDLTIQMLELYGIEIQKISNGFFIEGNQMYKAQDYRVEGDYSQAAFFLVGGVLNGAVKSLDLHHESKQGDRAILDIIKSVKGVVVYEESGYTAMKSQTAGTTIDISDCPDLGPIVALLLALSKGRSRIVNAQRLRLKESDRIESTVTTLKALGANIKEENDEIIIQGKKGLTGGVSLDSYNDHRIAMMISIAATICEEPIELTNPYAINKSYPDFYKDYISLGGFIK